MRMRKREKNNKLFFSLTIPLPFALLVLEWVVVISRHLSSASCKTQWWSPIFLMGTLLYAARESQRRVCALETTFERHHYATCTTGVVTGRYPMQQRCVFSAYHVNDATAYKTLNWIAPRFPPSFFFSDNDRNQVENQTEAVTLAT